MGIHYELDDDILVVYQGNVSDSKAIAEVMTRALADPGLKAGSGLLWNGVDAPAEATPEKMQKLLSLYATTHGRLSRYIAMVVASDLQYGVARMFSVYARDVDVQVRVFHDMGEARKWLRDPHEG